MADKTHWRNLTDMEHLRAECECFNDGNRVVLTIKEVKRETVKDNNGREEEKPVAYFEEHVLPMVLNVTNCKTIEKLYGGYIQDWIGKKIQVFATKTKVGGEFVPCLRVEKTAPTTNEVKYICSVCGKEITKDMYDKSVAKYGKPYCSKECLEQDTKGKQLL